MYCIIELICSGSSICFRFWFSFKLVGEKKKGGACLAKQALLTQRWAEQGVVIMSDPAVCSFITKILCSNGGCMDYKTIPQYLDLSEQQLQQILQDSGKERFLVDREGNSCQVLAVSPVRLCLRHECVGCERLHVCKNYIKSKCYRPTRGKGWVSDNQEVILTAETQINQTEHNYCGVGCSSGLWGILEGGSFLYPACH